MRRSLRFTSALALGIAATSAAHAQKLPERRPGLWEVQVTHKGAMADMQKQAQQQMQAAMAGMSPEQRKQMEQMMAGRGLPMPAASGEPDVRRICLTPEQAAREIDPRPDPDQRCERQITPVSANEARFTVTCSGPDGRMTGEGRAWDISPTGYRMQMSMKMQGQGGGPQTMEMEQAARWLGADCKGVKPIPD